MFGDRAGRIKRMTTMPHRPSSRSLGRRSALAGLAAVAGSGGLPAPATAQNSGQVVHGKDGWLFAAWEDIRRVDLAKCRRVAQLVGNAVGILQQAGIEVAISLTPTRARIYPEFLPDHFQPSNEAKRRYALVLEELRKSRAVVPDLADLFAGLRTSQPAEPAFFKADIHWTPMGAEAAATDMARQVKNAVRLPPPPHPGTQLGHTITMRYDTNDLAQLLPPAEQRRFPPQAYKVREVVRARGVAALLEDETADVVVVGNSYMQVGFGFPPMLSNQLGRPVSLVWKVGRVGPFRTLLDYLEGPLFKGQKPKLLVWHFLEGNMEYLPDVVSTFGQGAMPPQEFLSDLRRLCGVS